MPKAAAAAAAPDYAIPETDEQEEALRRALAARHSQKLLAATEFFTGETFKKFTEELTALQATKLPRGSATQQNVDNLVSALATMATSAESDATSADREAHPEKVRPMPISMPMLPAT